jgi:D-alanyl-D-alanine carboxypeptidase (penicillin-binding protein 5/6)
MSTSMRILSRIGATPRAQWTAIALALALVLPAWNTAAQSVASTPPDSSTPPESSAPPVSSAPQVATLAKRAIILDADTGYVLMEKNADVLAPPASLSKLMTVYMIFERLKDGRLSLDDKFLVSRKAWRTGGSKTFVEVGKRIALRDLLHGIIIQSGNDACIVVAEGLAGSEANFAKMMTARAREIGLTKSVFKNATGLPKRGHVMTARDLGTLARRLIKDFPEYYKIFSERSFTFNNIKQRNRNPLLYHDIGADGLKTGHTWRAGYGLVGSAMRDGRRVIVVILGLNHYRTRAREGVRLVDWAFRSFGTYDLFKAGTTIEEADVWLGTQSTVPLVIDQDVSLTLQRRFRSKLKARIVYTGPVPAPVAKGTPLGRLVVTVPGLEDMEVPLVAGDDVSRLGPIGRFSAAIRYMLWGESG